MPEKPERKKEGRGLDERLLEKIRERFAIVLEQEANRSKNWAAFLGENIAERIIEGERAPNTLGTENRLIGVAQEYGLSETETEELKSCLLQPREKVVG